MKACYLHVPFCKDICSYCDFTRCRYHEGLSDKWLLRICKEIHEKLHVEELETMYIGGGTPTVLSDMQLEALLQQLSPYTKHVKEYTIEANIDSLNEATLRIMKRYGVNRISLGVQTLNDTLLMNIHRLSNREDALRAIEQIHQNDIHNISIDLIYGLPGQTMEIWKHDLQDVVQNFDIQHISLYALSIEENSAFGRGGVQRMEEELEADMYEYALSYLDKNGFEHYEISSFAKGNTRSLHNQMYWHYEDFIGIGCGASGKVFHQRYDNTHNLQTYFENGSSPSYIELSKKDEMFEFLMMGLRMSDGIALQEFQKRFEEDLCLYYQKAIQQEMRKGLIEIVDGYLKTTYQGMLLLHDVLLAFMD